MHTIRTMVVSNSHILHVDMILLRCFLVGFRAGVAHSKSFWGRDFGGASVRHVVYMTRAEDDLTQPGLQCQNR